MSKKRKKDDSNKIFLKLKAFIFSLVGIFCLFYFAVCVLYAGFSLSWIWIWPLFACFCFVRFIMLRRRIKGKAKGNCPKLLVGLYYICFTAGLALFIFVESRVIGCMHTIPEPNLPYVIVLGARVRGEAPTRPLLLRMQRACEYLEENPDTVLIASGGQGSGEDISEAACIRNYMVDKGIDESRILLEDQSRSTEENIQNSFAMIPEDTSKVGILSNGFHIYRALRIANKQGHENVTGIASRTLLPVGIHYVVREFFAIVELELFG